MPIAYLILPAATFYDQVDKINEIIDFLNAPESPITTFANLTINPGPLLVGTNIDNGQANTQLRQNARSRALDVYGPVGFDDGTALAPSITFRNSPLTGFYRSAANTIGISSNSVQTGVITSSGFVGLNTTAPATRLDVNDNVTFRGVIFNQSNSTGYNDFIGSNSTQRWYLIASMPANNGGNYSALNLRGTFGMWQGVNSPRYKIDTYIGNRDAFVTNTKVERSENLTSTSIRPVAYRQTDGSVNVYVFCPATSFNIFSCQIYDAIQVTGNASYRTFTTTTPTGTLVYDAFTVRKDLTTLADGGQIISTSSQSANGGVRVSDYDANTVNRLWVSGTAAYLGTENDSNIPVIIRSNGFNIVSFSASTVTFNYPVSAGTVAASSVTAASLNSTDRIFASNVTIIPTVPVSSTQVPNITQTDSRYLKLSGGTLTDRLYLSSTTPIAANEAVSKSYVDGVSSPPVYISPYLIFSRDVTPPVRDIGAAGSNIFLVEDQFGTPLVGDALNWRTYTFPISTFSRIPSTAKTLLVKVVLKSSEPELAILYRQSSSSVTVCLNRLVAEGGGDNVMSQTIVPVPLNLTPERSIDLIYIQRNLSDTWDYKVSIVGYQ